MPKVTDLDHAVHMAHYEALMDVTHPLLRPQETVRFLGRIDYDEHLRMHEEAAAKRLLHSYYIERKKRGLSDDAQNFEDYPDTEFDHYRKEAVVRQGVANVRE